MICYNNIPTYPLLQSQMGVVLECLKYPDSTEYNQPMCMALPKEISFEKLSEVWNQVVQARQELRTCFVMIDGDIRQYADPAMQICMERQRMSEADFVAYKEKNRHQTFDLFAGAPLVRTVFVETEVCNYWLMVAHHAICDGLTLGQLLFQIDLPMASRGKALPAASYGMYEAAADEAASFGTPQYERAKDYYATTFADVEFVSLSQRASHPLGNMLRRSAYIPVAQVQHWCGAQGTPDNLLFQAAFTLVLSRLTRTARPGYYGIHHGRGDNRLRFAYGMFVKSVPMAIDVCPQQRVVDFVERFRTTLADSTSHIVYPFTHFCRDLQVEPRMCFCYQGKSIQEVAVIAGKRYDYTQPPKGKTCQDLNCIIYTVDDQYDIRLEASDALYSPSTLQMFADAVRTVVLQMMSQPDSLLSDITLVSAEQEQQLMALSYGADLGYDKSETLVHLFCKQARRTPDNVCLVFQDSRFTYRQVDELTHRLAVMLQKEYGVRPKTIVGVMIDRSELMMLYPLAIMKAGGAYMPLDYHFPAERLQFMCQDAGVGLILSEGARVAEAMPEYRGRVITSEVFDTLHSVEGELDPCLAASADHCMAVLYTSGSTGVPKGVVLEHKGVVNYCHWYVKEFKLTADDRTVGYADFCFDAHIIDLYPIASVGGAVYIISSNMRLDVVAMNEYMNRHRLNVAFLTTQIGCMFATSLPNKSLRVLSTGGEKMLPVSKPAFELYNVYGPTECSLFSTYYRITADFDGTRSCIGRPLDNYRLYVVDAQMQLLPQGASGELLVAGVGVARGYLNRPKLTAEKFVTFRGERAYRTGDLVRWDEDGHIEFIGRIDGQVKLRGLRIELGEIETCAMQCAEVEQAVALVRDEQLCLYYVSPTHLEPAALLAQLEQQLAHFMLPSHCICVEQIPLKPNGKTNVAALPQPSASPQVSTPPSTAMEQQLYDIAAAVIGHTGFGVDTNLISEGMTSLMAIRIAATIAHQLSMSLPIQTVLQTPRICDWAHRLHRATKALPYHKRKYYPLSENQRGLFVECELNPQSTLYNIPLAQHFPHTTALEMRRAIALVMDAHPHLKARFTYHRGDVMQIRMDEAEPQIDVIERSTLPTTEYLQSRVRPFVLVDEPLYRIEIYATPHPTDGICLFTDFHHTIFDGISGTLLLSHLADALRGKTLPHEHYTAFDRALYEREWIESDACAQAEAYFQSLVEGCGIAQLPRLSETQHAPGGRAQTEATLPTSAVDAACHHYGITPSSYFLTTLSCVLHRITKEKRILFATIDNGREGDELQNLTGMFAKTLPVAYTHRQVAFAQAARQLQGQVVESISRAIYPYQRVVKHLGAQPQLMYVYQGGIDLPMPGERIHLELDKAKMPISVVVYPQGGDYRICVEYDPHCHSTQLATTLARAVAAYAQNAATSEGLVGDISMLTPEEEHEIVALSAGKPLQCQAGQTIVHRFLAQAQATPHAVAVVDDEAHYTYAQLALASRRLAASLLRQGVAEGDMVCVALPRKCSFVVAVLAVMRCGAAYVPIDIEYPAHRRQFMIDDSECRLLIDQDFWEKAMAGEEAYAADSGEEINRATPAHRAYMIYTSGSTGRPKGVLVGHAALNHFITWSVTEMRLDSQSRTFLHTSFSFDASLNELLCPLAAGASVHVLSETLRRDLPAMAQYIRDKGLTGGSLSAQIGMMLINQYPSLPLSYLVLGGEQLQPMARTSIRLYNAYGPTECTVCTAYHQVNQQRDATIPIGRPVPGTYSFVCSHALQLLPQGMEGELCLAGPQLAEGYWRRPELTEQAFVDCPWLPGQKMYRTGDVCRYNADGVLEYLRRIDHQVKLRGYRIELGEVEHQALLHPGLTAAVADVIDHTLCLYYTAPKPVDHPSLCAHIARGLPEYMVPTHMVHLPAIPLTPNGKVDRRALPHPGSTKPRAGLQPRTPMELFFADVFARILDVEQVFADDDFFAIGGTSLTAIRIVIAAQDAGHKLNFGQVFAQKTPQRLAALFETAPTAPAEGQGLAEYDYSAIHRLLGGNTLQAYLQGEPLALGRILLLGSTGYLGIHVLAELLRHYPHTHITCMVRTEGPTASERLQEVWQSYFADPLTFSPTLRAVAGDIRHLECLAALPQVDVVINCAANVKHFAQGDEIEQANYLGVQQLVRFCQQRGSRLVHISTASVAGVYKGQEHKIDFFHERNLYKGQGQVSKYTLSKFLAERYILQAMAEGRIEAKVMRVGNLAPRYSDGCFQANPQSNAFMNRVKAVSLLRSYPVEDELLPLELSPVDVVARALLLLAQTPRENVVLHPFNANFYSMGDLFDAMNHTGLFAEPLPQPDYDARLLSARSNPRLAHALTSVLAYDFDNEGAPICPLIPQNQLTTRILRRMGFHWHALHNRYIQMFLRKLQLQRFFDE